MESKAQNLLDFLLFYLFFFLNKAAVCVTPRTLSSFANNFQCIAMYSGPAILGRTY